MLTDLLAQMGFVPPDAHEKRPRVGVSACLLGRKVRYDGTDKLNPVICHILGEWLTLEGFCPEVATGLPVPRPPIQVVQVAGDQRVRGVADPHQDFTDALRQYADTLPEALDGFIFKARSPSCGPGNTPLHDQAGRVTGLTAGAFAARLRQRFADLPFCSEEDLESDENRAAFVIAVYRHYRRTHG